MPSHKNAPKPVDIAKQFGELQQLRRLVQQAKLAALRHQGRRDPKSNGRRNQNRSDKNQDDCTF